MRIFLDTANVEEIRKAARLGILSGVTTNPSLMAREKGAPYKPTVQEICYIVRGHVSAEVLSLDADGMIEEARDVATWSPNVAIKVPLTAEGLAAISAISRMQIDDSKLCSGCEHTVDCPMGDARSRRSIVAERGVQTNATLIFSANQALLAARAGATYVSPFVGRLDDIGHDGMALIEDIVTIFQNYDLKTQVLAASIRHPQHITRAALLGADVATVPYAVLIQSTKHALTDAGIDKFLSDWKKAQEALAVS